MVSVSGFLRPIFLLLALVVLSFQNTVAQNVYQVQHQPPTVIERSEPISLSFDIPAININSVQDAFVFYKYDGEASYRQEWASYDLGTFTTELTIENQSAGSLEYFFMVEMTDGELITYPSQQQRSNPVRVDIVESSDTRAANRKSAPLEYTILSPEPETTVSQSDVLIAITLFYEEGDIDTTNSSFILTLDDQDITNEAAASNYFFSYSPEQIAPGPHQVSLRLAVPGDTLLVANWGFNVLDPNRQVVSQRGPLSDQQQTGTFVPEGQVELTAQNQEVGGISNDVLKGNVRLSGRKDNIRYSAYGLLTSQASQRLQPQNRYGAELYVGDWLEFQGGHIYPSLSRLTISGRRVQGINTEIHAFNGAVNAQFLHGKINRKISNIYRGVEPNTIVSNGTPVDTTYSLGFESRGTGTFKRNITGGRLSVGRGRTFQWGVNFLKVRDDTTSLTTINSFSDLMNERPELLGGLNQQYMNDLQANPDLLNISGNPQPKDNFIAGSDLMFNLFDNSLRFSSETSVSLLNEDISNGVLSGDENLDINISEDISNDLDRWAWLIIINENMNTLPLRFDVQGTQTTVESAYFPTSILANQSELNLNLPYNNFRMQYRWIGPSYASLANSTIRRDVAGITLSDRFQLLQNQLYVTVGYENLNDNVSDTKEATTNTQTTRTDLSWFPVSRDLPRVSFGVMYRNRDNGVSLNNPFVTNTGEPENLAVRNFEIAGGDTIITANPRFTNTTQITSSISQQFNLFDLSHDASLNLSFLNSDDEVFHFGGTQSSTVNISLQSRFSTLPLNTKIGFNVNNTETLGGLSTVNVVGFSVGGTMILMDNKLNLNTTLAITSNNIESTSLQVSDNNTSDPRDDFYQPQTDSFGNRVINETQNNLFIIRMGGQYNINSRHAVMANFSYTNISNQLSSLNPPNDHTLQARYIYRF